MPRYYIHIEKAHENLIRKRIIDHCNIDYFEHALNQKGFIVKTINEVGDDVNLEDISEISTYPIFKKPVKIQNSKICADK
jgi:hypothetical protein